MIAILIRSSDVWHMALQETPDGSHTHLVESGHEVVVWPQTVEEYRQKAHNLVRGEPGSVTGRTWDEMRSHPPGPRKLDADIPVLLAVLKYAQSQGKRATDPVTYGDLWQIAKLIRDRNISLEDDGTV